MAKMMKCGCGCGAEVTPGRRYRIGHDAKHKSALLTAATVGPQAGRAKARATLRELDWEGHLAIREAMLAKRAKPKAGAAKAATPKKARAPKPIPSSEIAVGDGRVPASVATLAHAS